MNTFPRHIFRAYDIRGVDGLEIHTAFAKKLGQSFASILQAHHLNDLVVGYDGRVSSQDLAQSLMAGLVEMGVNVVNVGLVPTPGLYFACHHLGIPSGIMVTGSHNPATDNGFKMVLAGRPFAGDDVAHLYDVMHQDHESKGQGAITQSEVLTHYIEKMSQQIQLRRPLKVVVDAGNGAGGVLLPTLYEKMGAVCVPLYHEVDGLFPNHHPDPSRSDNLQDLILRVQQENADLGMAFDGDADRLGVVTKTGKVIPQDKLLMLFAKAILQETPDSLVMCDVKCSHFVKHVVEAAGGRAMVWKTGHSHIKNKMRETGAVVAAEMSGHFFFKDRWYGFDDAPYAGARMLELLDAAEKDLDALVDALPQSVSTEEILLPVDEQHKFQIIDILKEYDFGRGERHLIDGIRVEFQKSWGLVRASNTSPNLVLRFEADDQIELTQVMDLFQDALASLPTPLYLK